ncbi:hypothetical protein PS15m_010914 [Mucor circinelloides]
MHSPPDIVYAIHNFEAENEDEVTFRYGEPIVILEKDDQFLDGWWQGRNTLGQTGLFPMNYTSPKKPSNANNRITSYNDDIYRHSRMSSGTSSATISSDEYRAVSTTNQSAEAIANVPSDATTFGVSNSSPLDWDMEEVVTWLESVGLESVVDNFIDQDITGDVLMSLDHNALKELGIHAYGRRYKVLNAIKSLDVSTSTQTEAANSTDKRQTINTCYSRYGSVTENLSNNKTNSISSLNSCVSSTTPRSAICRNSLSTRSSSSHNNDSHSSCIRSENSGLMLETRPSFNSATACKRSTFDGHSFALSSTAPSQQRNTLSDLSMYDASMAEDLPTQNSNSSTFPEYEGWIYKQSDRYKTWNKRWFVLHGTNLFYFKNPKDARMKGIVHLHGYRVVLQDANSHSASTKKYYFKLHHDHERTFFLYTSTVHDMKNWVQALMKSTIQRDLCVPVLSSNTVDTVSLEIAQKMKPRPPSILMCSNKDRKMLNYRQTIKNDVVSNTLEEELDETLLWMEHPSDQDQEPFQKLIIRSYPSPAKEDEQQDCHYIKQREQSYFFASPTQAEEEEEVYPRQQSSDGHQYAYETNSFSESPTSSTHTNNAILYWVNHILAPTIEIHDLSSAFRSGRVLVQLLETLSGQSIAPVETQASPSMNMLDTIVEAFKFMNREGVINNGYTIKDVFSGNEEKIIDMILSIKVWSEEDRPLHI